MNLEKRNARQQWIGLALVVMSIAMIQGEAYPQESIVVSVGGPGPVYPENPVRPGVMILSEPPDTVFGRIDLLIDCGEIACWFDSVSANWFFYECGWEHLSYDVMLDSLIHIEIVPDLPDVPGAPLCYYYYGYSYSPISLWFTIPADSTTDCAVYPLKFRWFQCDDNRIESRNGDTVFVSDTVFNDAYWLPHEPLPPPAGIPSYSGTPNWCLDYIAPDAEVTRHVNFYSGSIRLHCEDSVYSFERGDINLNGICNEIADMVIFVNYFLQGEEVFEIDPEEQIGHTDINTDGVVLTFRDLVYMYRIIIGDILIGEPPEPDSTVFPIAAFEQNTGDGTVEVDYPDGSLAGVLLTFDDTVTITSEYTGGFFSWTYHYDGEQTRFILMVDRDNEIVTGPILSLEGSGVLVEAKATDFYDSELSTVVSVTPGEIGIGFAVGLVVYLFLDGPLPEPTELADADCSGYVDIDDIVWVIEYIFMGGPAPGDC